MNAEQQLRTDFLYEQQLTNLKLQGKRPATIDAYSRAVRRIIHHFDKAPDPLSTDDLKQYFAQLINTYSWSAVRGDRNGLQFFFKHVFDLRSVQHQLGHNSLNTTARNTHLTDISRKNTSQAIHAMLTCHTEQNGYSQ
ncbi:hypothetical protein C9J48_12010 [Photobacterium profundum]|uniref:Core-binding (CB) domain-containing protein n=1 Tax=Photobacterium profundum 3TCK TaxID=314280 RepID=Q1YYG6_9GAMM|nr:site-specific integrase [Photobacterium profundum]EAS41356.1 hypothetical protein P3TCK_07529 [Photobacterium profundum 3TCK]PSV62666.1 hypothetical protein C9J48_12010 [Photobacterium profundum]